MNTIFSREKVNISVGDYVITYATPENIDVVQVDSTVHGSYHSRLGRFLFRDMIGKPFGSKIKSHDGSRTIYLLRPTPELWTRVLSHRTQILYIMDICFISSMLEIRPGSVVIESGTGSASFSHTLAQMIAPHGHLYTFEFHSERCEKSRKELQDHGFMEEKSSLVTIAHRDVCLEGFALDSVADSVFLDLPAPWLAISSAKTALRKDRLTRISTFSPCIEQVQKTCSSLKLEGFVDIEMYECLIREHQVDKVRFRKILESDFSLLVSKPQMTSRGHTSFLTFASLLASSK